MKKRAGWMATIALIASCASFNAQSASNAALSVPVYAVDSKGQGKPLGSIKVTQTPYGLAFWPQLKGLPPGIHGFHIHEHPSCGPADGDHGPAAAMAAGGHWDPNHTNHHAGPFGDGHLGDLPALYVGTDGHADYPVLAPRIKSLNEIEGHALMIHEGGDNYSDHPKPLGGGGARLACGAIASSSK